MRLRKRSQPGMPPSQVEALGRVTSADLSSDSLNDAIRVEAQGRKASANFAALAYGAPARSGSEDGRAAGQKTPLLIGGESPQVATTGECSAMESISDSIVLDRNQNPVIKLGVRCIKGQKVGIDWVSCVFEPSASWMYFFIGELKGANDFSNADQRVAGYVKEIFAWVLGFKEDENTKWKIYENGLNGYHYAVGMPLRSGIVHVGHSSGTVLVTISGQGALMALPGWESRLHRFLTDVKGWLTRIDMAFDDYEGEYFPVRVMRERAKEGAFERGGRPPKIELRGAWEQDDPNNSGLTLYVGSRMSGKFTRIYEKGKQLGDESSPWVRAEVELHNSCYQLTLGMLLKPTQWFAAFYPCFEVVETGADRVELEYRTRIATLTLEHSAKWIRHQAGGHLAALRQFYSDSELLDMLVRPDAIPEAFLAANVACENLLAPADCLTAEPGFIGA